MKLSVSFAGLRAQRKHLGAKRSDWKIGSGRLNPRIELLSRLASGISIKIEDVNVGPGKPLTSEGEQIILYIKDTRANLWTLHNEPEKTRRFHIAECSTLEQMRDHGRFERYVVTN